MDMFPGKMLARVDSPDGKMTMMVDATDMLVEHASAVMVAQGLEQLKANDMLATFRERYRGALNDPDIGRGRVVSPPAYAGKLFSDAWTAYQMETMSADEKEKFIQSNVEEMLDELNLEWPDEMGADTESAVPFEASSEFDMGARINYIVDMVNRQEEARSQHLQQFLAEAVAMTKAPDPIGLAEHLIETDHENSMKHWERLLGRFIMNGLASGEDIADIVTKLVDVFEKTQVSFQRKENRFKVVYKSLSTYPFFDPVDVYEMEIACPEQ